MEKQHRPVEVRLHKKSRVIHIGIDNGAQFDLPAEYLRVYSPSAEVRGHFPGQEKLQTRKERVGIEDIQPVGQYALKIFFDDGHKSGLYDWPYLYLLGQDAKRLWGNYLGRLQAAGITRDGPDPFDHAAQRETAENNGG